MFLALMLALAVQTAPPPGPPPTAAQLTEVYTLFVEGQALADAGDTAGAIAKYKKALDVLPGSSIERDPHRSVGDFAATAILRRRRQHGSFADAGARHPRAHDAA